MQPTDARTELPLKNLVVMELGHSVAGPFAGQILGDLGAQVIKVEKAHGGDDARAWGPSFLDDTSTTYLSLNRNKYSVSVNLKDQAQLRRLQDFIRAKADVVLQNLKPGSVETELAAGPASAWVKRLEEAGVPCGPLQDVGQVIAAPHTQALGILQETLDHRMRTVGLPISFDGVRPGVRLAPAQHGEHTDQILGS